MSFIVDSTPCPPPMNKFILIYRTLSFPSARMSFKNEKTRVLLTLKVKVSNETELLHYEVITSFTIDKNSSCFYNKSHDDKMGHNHKKTLVPVAYKRLSVIMTILIIMKLVIQFILSRSVLAGGTGGIAPPNERFCMVLPPPTESVTWRFI